MIQKIYILLLFCLISIATIGQINIGTNFRATGQFPLDNRTVFEDTATRNTLANIYRYEGLLVYVKDLQKTYQLKGGLTNTCWVEVLQTVIVGDTTNFDTTCTGVTIYSIADGKLWEHIKKYDEYGNFLSCVWVDVSERPSESVVITSLYDSIPFSHITHIKPIYPILFDTLEDAWRMHIDTAYFGTMYYLDSIYRKKSDSSYIYWRRTGFYTTLTNLFDSVGVGTNTPTTKLEVIGNAKINDVDIGIGNTATGSNNTLIGKNTNTISALKTTALGAYALENSTQLEGENVAVGYLTAQDAGGIYNTIIGAHALKSGSGNNNSVLGYKAGYNSSADNGIWIGYKAGYQTAVDNSLFIHNNEADSNSATIYADMKNTTLGDIPSIRLNGRVKIKTLDTLDGNALYVVTQDSNTGYLKLQAMGECASGDYSPWDTTATAIVQKNVAKKVHIGSTATPDSLFQVTGGAKFTRDVVVNGVRVGRGKENFSTNTVVGNDALKYLTTGDNNTAIGALAGASITSGERNTVTGYRSLMHTTTGKNNTSFGMGSSSRNTTGSNHTVIGYAAMAYNTTGYSNTAVGVSALCSNTTASNLVAVGDSALYKNTGTGNTAVGSKALYANVSGKFNTAIGFNSLKNNINEYNTGVGYSSLISNTNGYNNSVVGYNAMGNNTDGYSNTSIGYHSLSNNTTGYENVAIGEFAGMNYTGNAANLYSNKSIFIGNYTKAKQASQTNETVIGYNTTGKGSNTTTIGNTSTTDTYLAGALTVDSIPDDSAPDSVVTVKNGKLYRAAMAAGYDSVDNPWVYNSGNTVQRAGGNVGIGTTSPVAPLTIQSTTNTESAILGDELIDGTGWTSAGWTGSFATGFTHTAGNTSSLQRDVTISSDTRYHVSFKISSSGSVGSISVSLGGVSSGAIYTYNSTWGFGPTTVNSTGDLIITPSSDFYGKISEISVKPITDSYEPTIVINNTGNTTKDRLEIRSSITDKYNTFIGWRSGRWNTSGFENTAFGARALGQNTTGHDNTAVGQSALSVNNIGIHNTAVGDKALQYNTSGINNTAVGTDAMVDNVTGTYNTSLGFQSLYQTTAGNYNTALGFGSLWKSTSNYNTAIGAQSLFNTTTGTNNVAIGYTSGITNTTGSYNTFLNGGTSVTNAEYSMALGYGSSVSGSNQFVYGGSGVQKHIFGGGSVGINTTNPLSKLHVTGSARVSDTAYVSTVTGGADPSSKITLQTTTGSGTASAVALQIKSGANDRVTVLHDGKVGIGTTNPTTQLMQKSTTATESAPLSAELLTSSGWTSSDWTGDFASGWTHTVGNTTTLLNSLAAINATKYQITWTITGRTAGTITITFGGWSSGAVSSTGNTGPTTSSTASLVVTPTSDFNGKVIISIKIITGVYAATYAIADNTNANAFEIRSSLASLYNQFVGVGAGRYNTTGYSNTANGMYSLYSNTTGNYNTANGMYSLYLNTTGYYNTANGVYSLYLNTTGYSNTANGMYSLYSNTTGNYNTANGMYSLYSNTTGSINTANGRQSLYSNTTGNYNTANGMYSLYSNTTGYYNTANGYNAGRYIADGSTANATGSNSIFIGAETKALAGGQTNQIVIGYNAIGNGSNSVTIGHTDITKTVLRGNVGINTTNPQAKLHVAGGIMLDGTDTTGVGSSAKVGTMQYYNGNFWGLIAGTPPTWVKLNP